MADDILKDALEQFKESQDGSDFNRDAYEEDVRFSRLGEQWPDTIEKTRKAEGRPCLTINKLPAFVRKVVNDARQNKPSIAIHPVDNFADVDTAEVINGIVRSIERNDTGADVAYDTAIDHAVSGGFGFFRIAIDYAHDETFELEAKIKRIANPLMVHWDANTTEFDASDWMYAFVSDFVTKEEFKKRHKKAKPVSFEGDSRDQVNYWLEDDKIRLAEYFKREEVERKLLLLSSGIAIREELFTDEVRAVQETLGVKVLKERTVQAFKVKRRIMSGVEVLEEEDWPGSLIPIVPVWGEEVIIDGKRHVRSMIRDAKGAQTMFNFWRSATTELVALAPRAPWVGPEGFVPPGQEEKWATANTRSHSYLEYQQDKRPTREAFAGVPAGALQEALSASDDMKATMSIYDSSLGAQSNEVSGKAISARQRQSDVANFHFSDNLSRAIRYAGRVLVEIIPAVYSPRETIRILGQDMKEKVVKLVSDSMRQDPLHQGPYQEGEEKLYDLTVGKYDVTVSAGPSYATQREETREVLVDILDRVPGAAAVMGDIVIEYLDIQGADKVAKRLQMLLPPQIQQAEGIAPVGLPMPGQPGIPPANPVAPTGAMVP